MERELRSSVDAAAWAAVHDELLHGVIHAANNRVAALGGIVQLQEHGLATPTESLTSTRDEVARLRALMEAFRDLTVRRGEQREAVRLSDALNSAKRILSFPSATRGWTVTIADAGDDVRPVLLWPADPFRFATLLLVAAGSGNKVGEFFAAVLRSGAFTEASVVGPGTVAAVQGSRAYQALVEAAEREGGSVRVEPTNHGASVELTLALPGLASAT